jgi:tetratricopeptide (TPR) repeat protein
VGACDPLWGLEIMALGPGVGAILGALWGASVAWLFAHRAARPRAWGAALALAAPLGGIAISVARFYATPMVHAYDPFVGYFSGTLYDTVVSLAGLRVYRLGSAATIVAAFAVGSTIEQEGETLRWRRGLRPSAIALGSVALLASVAHLAAGPRLGHWHTRGTIEAALGGEHRGERCRVVHATSLSAEDVNRLASDCDAHVVAIEAWLGARGPETISVFAFEDEQQKAALIGASSTNLAKPWRGELYIHDTQYPAPSLGHELAHVVASSIGRGPFRIAGHVGGWLPNPGLIEGLAVAASPKDDELSPAEWGRAMRSLGLLPRLDSLFSLAFLSTHGATAYLASGAFVAWVHERFGAAVLVSWYGGVELPGLVQQSWPELEQGWHASLDALPLEPSAALLAKARFDRPGFFHRRCPRVVDACREEANLWLAQGDAARAVDRLLEARALEPKNPSLAIDLAEASLGLMDQERSTSILESIVAQSDLPTTTRDRARVALADRALLVGNEPAAIAAYDDVLPRTFDEARARSIELRRLVARDEPLRRLVLTSQGAAKRPRGASSLMASALTKLTLERPDDPLSPYLLGRQLFEADQYAAAIEQLELATKRGLASPRLRAEALRNLVVASCALGQGSAARERLERARKDGSLRPARLETLTRLVERCSRR